MTRSLAQHTLGTPLGGTPAVARSLAQLKAGRTVAQQMAEIRKKGFGRIVITPAQAKWLVGYVWHFPLTLKPGKGTPHAGVKPAPREEQL